MARVAVFHHIGEVGEFTNTLEEILAFDGILSFDGAYESVYHNREALAEREPILFVQGVTVGSEGVCTKEQISDLAENYGFTLGWHGYSHRKLTELPDHVVMKELNAPEQFRKLYAYPHGDWDMRVAKIVKQMGYLRAYSTAQGEEGNDFAIPRAYI